MSEKELLQRMNAPRTIVTDQNLKTNAGATDLAFRPAIIEALHEKGIVVDATKEVHPHRSIRSRTSADL